MASYAGAMIYNNKLPCVVFIEYSTAIHKLVLDKDSLGVPVMPAVRL